MRKKLIILHTFLAAFFLPMGVMYPLTGGLYGVGVKGSYDAQEHILTLEAPLTPDLPALATLTERALKDRSLDLPTGSASVKKGGTSFYFEWTGTARDIELHPTSDPLQAKLKVKETSSYRYLVQLHKAKGGPLFKWFAAAWMCGLILLFLSGGALAFSLKPYRKLALAAVLAGLATFASFAWIS